MLARRTRSDNARQPSKPSRLMGNHRTDNMFKASHISRTAVDRRFHLSGTKRRRDIHRVNTLNNHHPWCMDSRTARCTLTQTIIRTRLTDSKVKSTNSASTRATRFEEWKADVS